MGIGSKHKKGSRLSISEWGDSLTKQSFKDECDVNKLLKRYVKTGALSHFAKHGGEYMNVTPVDFQEAMNTVITAQALFDDLPAEIRGRFQNDPAQFLGFVQDPANADELLEMGLRERRRADPVDRMVDELAGLRADLKAPGGTPVGGA